MSTEQLEALLIRESFGAAQMTLRSIYLLCDILACREPARSTVRDIFLEFARQYADNQQLSEC